MRLPRVAHVSPDRAHDRRRVLLRRHVELDATALATRRHTGTDAFASNRNGNFEIYVMNADGTGVRRLTDDPSDDVDPAWSA